jgi:hypothetical protein
LMQIKCQLDFGISILVNYVIIMRWSRLVPARNSRPVTGGRVPRRRLMDIHKIEIILSRSRHN